MTRRFLFLFSILCGIADVLVAAASNLPRRALEERAEQSRTLGDPNHMVPYQNHPFDKRRSLQQQTIASLFQPIRIGFDTGALDRVRTAENAAHVDFVKNELLPQAAIIWEQSLSVIPVSGILQLSASQLENGTHSGDLEFSRVPSQHISTGFFDTDLMFYVSAATGSESQFCSPGMIAVAVACNFDQYDRPTAGAIHVCLDQIDLQADGTASDATGKKTVDVVVHEMAHVLGFSWTSFRYFWDWETGAPRTPRPLEPKRVTCVNHVHRDLLVPAETTLKFAQATNGQRYASIVTPRVAAVARNQLDCQSLEGAKLENQPMDDFACTGDHWDAHDFYPEIMSSVVSSTANILSPLTLALFEDSGWYKANYTMAKLSSWGLGAGCNFVELPCLVENSYPQVQVPEYAKGFFCMEESKRGCSPTLEHKLECTVLDYSFLLPTDLPPDRFRYFPDEPTKGGPRQTDYCPVFGNSYNGLDAEALACTNPTNQPIRNNLYSEIYGGDSKCIESLADTYNSDGDGKCYRTACVREEMALKINVRGEWLTCDFEGQELTVRVGAGLLALTLVCPRLSAACPELFCPLNCAGKGVCNYTNSVGGIRQPKCECLDPNDISPGCTDSFQAVALVAPTSSTTIPPLTPPPTSSPTVAALAPTSAPIAASSDTASSLSCVPLIVAIVAAALFV